MNKITKTIKSWQKKCPDCGKKIKNTQVDLAKMIGISFSTLNKTMHHPEKAKRTTIEKIIAIFDDLSFEDFR